MRHLLLLIAIFCAPTLAGIYSVRIDTSSSNIPTAYTTVSTSKVLAGVLSMRGVFIDNRTASEIAVECSTGTATTAPSNTSSQNVYVNATSTVALGDIGMGGTCYVRSMSGSAISSGVVVIMAGGG